MSVFTKIKDALYDGTEALYSSTSYNPPIIFTLGKNEPSSSYVAINFLTLEQTGRVMEDPSLTVVSEDRGEQHFQSFYEANVQFTFYGSEAGEICEVFHRLVNNYSESRHSWAYLGLSPLSKSPIRFNPQRRDTQWEDFFNFDITFSYRVHDVKEVQWVEHITMVVNGGEQKTIPPLPQP